MWHDEKPKKTETRLVLFGIFNALTFALPSLFVGIVKVAAQLLFWVLCVIILVGWIKGVPVDINNFIKW